MTVGKPYRSFQDIPRFIRDGDYQTHVSWEHLDDHITRYVEEKPNLNLDPDYQRGHVWTRKQQTAYIEFKLQGGMGSDILRFNCPGWMRDWRGPFELVDGKQRLQAIRLFLCNTIPAFGRLRCEFDGHLDLIDHRVLFAINALDTRAEVLQWYLQLNGGGTPHTKSELTLVARMLEEERKEHA